MNIHTYNMVASLLVLGCALGACARNEKPVPTVVDGGLTDGGSADIKDGSVPDASTTGRTAELDCEGKPNLSALKLVPSQIFVFAGAGECEVLPARFLLVNETTSDVHVTGLGTEVYAKEAQLKLPRFFGQAS